MSAYERGVTSFHLGLSLEENPYESSEKEHLDWCSGWNDAEEGMIKLLEFLGGNRS